MRFAIGFALSSLLLADLARSEVVLENFANAATLELEGVGAVYRLGVPEFVYGGITRADLGDLRVFNAAGAIVPQDLRLPPTNGERFETVASLPFYPLEDEPRDLERLRLSLTRSERLTKLNIDTGDELKSGAREFIIDARDLADPLHRLEVDWQAPSSGARFLAHVSLEASADLHSWRVVVADAVLADLRHLGHRLRRTRIDLPAAKHRFYRLKFKRASNDLALTGLRGWSNKRRPTSRFRWRDAQAQPGEKPGEYKFANLMGMHLYRIRVGLPERNTLASATLYSRAKADLPWTRRLTTSLYRLKFPDGELTHPDLTLGGITDRQWRLSVDQSGGGLGAGMPTISLAWQPHELAFIARGEPPFRLAWGSARVNPPATGAASPFDRVNDSAMLTARLTESVSHPGGEAALDAPIDSRRYILWGVLIMGALAVVGLAMRLLHSMNKDSDPV